MWVDRLTGELLDNLPETIESGRYQLKERAVRQGQATSGTSGLLIDDGSEQCTINGERRVFTPPPKSLDQKVELFGRILETINPDVDEPGELVSPLMPEGLVNEDSHLNSFELKLLEIIDAGHLHQMSMRPRLDLHYEDEVTDVARAKKLAKGALVHLASHSECWQRQTLSGVIPKRVKAQFSEDDFNIYENLVYARLLDKIEQYLIWRVGTLRQLQSAVSEALKFYGANDLDYRLTEEICRLWGKAFTQDSTSKASEQLTETLDLLGRALGIIRGLKQRGLYLLVSRSAQMGGGLHLTNILSHDQHYRHLPILWNELKSVVGGKRITPEERREHNEVLNRAYSQYAGLVLRHALLPYLGTSLTSEWAGLNLRLRQVGLDWQLFLPPADSNQVERVLLEVVPWMGFTNRPESIDPQLEKKIDLSRVLAWPNLGEDNLQCEGAPTDGSWVQLSPFDLYGVERFGYLVDQLLQRELVSAYGRPIRKVPNKSIDVAAHIAGVEASANAHEIRLVEALPAEVFSKIEGSLIGENALAQAQQLRRRQQEILELEKCPVCSGDVRVIYQQPDGFMADCSSCRTKRYLRGSGRERQYEQCVARLTDFKQVGRRSFLFQLCDSKSGHSNL